MRKNKSTSILIKKSEPDEKIKQQSSMYKHLNAVLTAKTYLDVKKPKEHVNKANPNKKSKFSLDELNNVKQTYTNVLTKKAYLNNKEPKTINLGKSKFTKVASHEEIEHKRRLKALAERIPIYGSKKDRLKNKFDPITNPVYFFRAPKDYKGIQDVELVSYNTKMNKIGEEPPKNLYTKNYINKDISEFYLRKKNKENDFISSTNANESRIEGIYRNSMNAFLDLEKLLKNSEVAEKILMDTRNNNKNNEEDLYNLKYKHDVNPE